MIFQCVTDISYWLVCVHLTTFSLSESYQPWMDGWMDVNAFVYIYIHKPNTRGLVYLHLSLFRWLIQRRKLRKRNMSTLELWVSPRLLLQNDTVSLIYTTHVQWNTFFSIACWIYECTVVYHFGAVYVALYCFNILSRFRKVFIYKLLVKLW